MPFDTGTLSLAICQMSERLPEDAIDYFIAKKAGPLATVGEEPKVGWVTGRHLLDTDLNEETAKVGGYLHLVLRTAQRKIPASLFKAECKIEELARLQASGGNRLARKQLKEIKEGVTDRLLKQMPPTLAGVPFVADPATGIVYVGVSSPSKLDSFLGEFGHTLHLEPAPLGPEAAAEKLFNINPLDVPALTFSPDLPPDDSDAFLGRDFVTWMWYFQEIEGGVFEVPDHGPFGLMIDGPLTFVGDVSGAQESVVRKGTPTISAEARAALINGKKLKKARFTFARGNEVWTFNLDAENFLFSSLSLPPGEALDAASHFQERIMLLHDLRSAFFDLYKRYLNTVTDDGRCEELQKAIIKWVSEMGK